MLGSEGKGDRGVVGERIELDGNDVFLLGTPALSDCLPTELTRAEKEVTGLLLEGLTNHEIARTRGTSVRTVANQVAAIFRKLKVTARAELGQALLERQARARRTVR